MRTISILAALLLALPAGAAEKNGSGDDVGASRHGAEFALKAAAITPIGRIGPALTASVEALWPFGWVAPDIYQLCWYPEARWLSFGVPLVYRLGDGDFGARVGLMPLIYVAEAPISPFRSAGGPPDARFGLDALGELLMTVVGAAG
jgi:hypothetical protein